ncbi:MAG: ADP-ribosylglycohydrolase family protein [Clostridia bacterium]|nr:ADP-ribosylglycohydrolase family protein [Clostridia bacterium]
MLGAIIGDLAGSIYEYEQIKNCRPIKINSIIEDNSFFSDDTILTMAIADAILNNVNYENKLKEYAIIYSTYIPNHIPYFKTMFSPNFVKWAKSDYQGESAGNGAMMRISPVGFLFNTEKDVVKNSYLATIPSHNSDEAINCAKTVALIIFYARQGLSKQEIINKLNLKITKPNIEKFNYTCAETIDLCLYSLFNSNSFEESIRIAISFGGDTDTNACIVGSMAEAMFGIDKELKNKALAKLPSEFKKVIKDFYNRINNQILVQTN